MAGDAPMPLPCTAPRCHYSTPLGLPDFATITQHLQVPTQAAHTAAVAAAQAPCAKVDKRPRPEATLDMTEHEFKFYQSEWSLYTRATKISGQNLVDELWTTMSPDLKKLAFDQGDVETLITEELMMARIKSLAVSVLHAAIHTVSLHEAQQLPEESTKSFAARVRGIASNCELQKKCNCGETVSYTEETVYHVVLAGLRDRDLQERCTAQALLKNITNIFSLVAYCSAEESGRLGTPGTVGGVRSSTYRKQQRGGDRGGGRGGDQGTRATPGNNPPAKCNSCGEGPHSGYSQEVRSKECRAYSMTCHKCGMKSHLAKVCKRRAKKVTATLTEVREDTQDSAVSEFAFFYGLELSTTSSRRAGLVADLTAAGAGSNQPVKVPMCHMEFTYESGWGETNPRPSPTLPVALTLHSPSYTSLDLQEPSTSPGRLPKPTVRRAVADTGAQMDILSLATLKEMGLDPATLIPVKARVVGAVRGSKLEIVGGVLLEVRAPGAPDHACRTVRLFYVATNVTQCYLSLSCLQALEVLSSDFPSIGAAATCSVVEEELRSDGNPPPCTNTGVLLPGEPPCSCPARTLQPKTPASLPCAATQDNLPQLNEYLINRYRSSTFNTCERQQLPLMKGSPPLELHVSPDDKPVSSVPRAGTCPPALAGEGAGRSGEGCAARSAGEGSPEHARQVAVLHGHRPEARWGAPPHSGLRPGEHALPQADPPHPQPLDPCLLCA